MVNSLWNQAAHKQRGFSQNAWNSAVIKELGQSGESAVIPHLVPILRSGNREQITVAAQAIDALLAATQISELPALDEAMRAAWYDSEWQHLTPRELSKWVGPGDPGVRLIRLASMHSNGFIREAAVRHLMLFKDGSEIPYLLLRTNDWVPQVRSAAHDAIANRVKPECAEHFVRYLTLVVRLQRLRRADQRALVENIHGLLTGPEARPAMINLINHEVKEIRRASFSILTAPGTANRSEILKIVLKAQDSAIRLAGARAAGGAFDLEQLRATLTAFTQDRFAPIRQIGIRYWATLFPDAAQQPLLQGLMDQSTAVRGEARFHLRDLIGMDFRSFYCDAIANGNVTSLSIAIAGLGETGRPADAKVLLPYLSHRLARIRRAAVAQVMRLGGDAYIASIVERIMDDSRSVSTQARKSLQKYSSRIGAAELWTLLQTQQAPHIRRNLLYLIAMLPKWECIGYLLQTVCDTHGSIAKLAAQFVARWESVYNRSQTTPTREQLHRAQIALETAAPSLPEAVVSTLGFAIRSFKSA